MGISLYPNLEASSAWKKSYRPREMRTVAMRSTNYPSGSQKALISADHSNFLPLFWRPIYSITNLLVLEKLGGLTIQRWRMPASKGHEGCKAGGSENQHGFQFTFVSFSLRSWVPTWYFVSSVLHTFSLPNYMSYRFQIPTSDMKPIALQTLLN